MLLKFKDYVSVLYMKWEDYIMESLKPVEKAYVESICFKTATKDDLKLSLYKLSYFLVQKFDRKVIVAIDEYEVSNNYAYDHGYFNKVHFLYPPL